MLGLVFALLMPSAGFGEAKAHPPLPRHQESWIKGDNYPTSAFKQHAEGRVTFTLTIDADARITACRITATSGNADLDRTTCDLYRKNARFYPAADDRGRRVAGEWSGAMRWVLPQ